MIILSEGLYRRYLQEETGRVVICYIQKKFQLHSNKMITLTHAPTQNS